MRIDEVRRVAVVGAGTMGQQIAFQCAGHGFEVVIHDVSSPALESVRERIESYAHGLLDGGAITPKIRDSAAQRIEVTPDPSEAAQNADLLSEAIPEDPKLKGRVLAQFGSYARRGRSS